MPVTLSWYDEDHTIICYRFERTWKLEEIYDVLNAGYELIAKAGQPIDTIFDFSATSTPPPQILTATRYASRRIPPNLRHTALCGLDPFLIILANVAQRIAPRLMKDVVITRTLAEAVEALKQLRTKDSPPG